jgi:hypothetical protein
MLSYPAKRVIHFWNSTLQCWTKSQDDYNSLIEESARKLKFEAFYLEIMFMNGNNIKS